MEADSNIRKRGAGNNVGRGGSRKECKDRAAGKNVGRGGAGKNVRRVGQEGI